MHRSTSGAAPPPELAWPLPANTVSEAYPTGGARRGALGSGVSPKGSSLSLVAGPEETSVKNPKTLATVLRRVCAALISVVGSSFTCGCCASTCRSYVGGYGTGATIPCVVVSVERSSHKGIDGAAPVVVCEGTGRASSTYEEADPLSPRVTGVSSTECSGISSKDGGTASESLGSRTRVTPGGAGASAPSSAELLGSVAVSYWRFR